MKNRLSPHPAPVKQSRLPKARHARVYLSGEFLAWCQRHAAKPAGIAACILHTYALESPGRQRLTIVSERPDADERLFEQPGKEAA